MKYRRLGLTDLNVSVVGVGTWQFGGEWGQTYTPDGVRAILHCARDHGINLIDTAECYGDHRSEELIGEALEGDRASWIIATKFGHRFHAHLRRTDHWSASEVLAQLESSLRALRTDYVDIYQFHSGDDEAFRQDELWTCLDKQVRAGKVRHLGNSMADCVAAEQTSRAREVGVSVVQVTYNALDRSAEEFVLPLARAQDLGVLVREPLANGLLSGKYGHGACFNDSSDWRSTAWSPAALELKVARVERWREDLPPGVPMAAWALAWALKHDAVTAVIPGCRTIEQVAVNASACRWLDTVVA